MSIDSLVVLTKRAGAWNCPTYFWSYPQLTPVRGRVVKTLQDAGAGLLLGTDATRVDPSYLPKVHNILQGMVEHAGLTPYQALATGTRNVAHYFGTTDETGTIAVGKRADLVLITGNPLQDIKHTVQPAGVMLGGRWLAREEIDRQLAEVKAAAASP